MCGLRGLFNGLPYIINGAAVGFPVGTGDVRGLFPGGLGVGDDVKKFGGLELGTGEEGRGDVRTGVPYEHSIKQSLVKPGELGDRGDIDPGEGAETDSVKSDRFSCSSERPSVQEVTIS